SKSATATRYLSNTGSSNNPAWAQVNLANGVTGELPLSNLATQAAFSLVGNFTGSSASPTASTIGGLTQKASPAANDLILIQDQAASGALKFATIGSAAVQGPGSSAVGNIAFFNNTSGSLLGASPAFQSGNPGNASLYSQLGTVADGTTTVNNAMQVGIGAPLPSSEQFGSNPHGIAQSNQQAIVGTAVSNATDTVADALWGVVGYAK